MHPVTKILAAFGVAVFASSAGASTITTEDLSGHDHGCVGTWSAASFDDCTAPEREGYAGGRMMAHFNLGGPGDGVVTLGTGGVALWFHADGETGHFYGEWSTFARRALWRIAFFGHARPEVPPPPAVVPVPATAELLLGGLAALAGLRRRRA